MATPSRSVSLPVLLLAAMVAACAPEADTEPAAPPLLVDAVDQTTLDSVVLQSTTIGLTALDAGGQVVPGLARSWRISDDGLSIVFRLRAAHFSDGSEIAASDMAAAIEAGRNGQRGTLVRDLLAGVTQVSSPVPAVVELQLSTPQPELLELLAMPDLAVRPRQGNATAGPFVLAEADGERAGTAVQLRRNPQFYDSANVSIAAVDIDVHPPGEAVLRFNRGETDLVLGGGIDGYPSARVTARRDTLFAEQRRSTFSLLVNYHHPLLGKRDVRRALQLAINRERLAQAIYGTLAATPVYALSPSNIADYTPPAPAWTELPFVSRQLEATRFLADAGHDKDELHFTVAISSNPDDTRLMTEVAADLGDIGVRLTLVRRGVADHLKAVADGDFDLALVRTDAPNDAPVPFLVRNLCDHNRLGICLREADQLVIDSWQAASRSKRLSMLAEAERLWAEDGTTIGLIQPFGWSLASVQLAGVAANSVGRHDLGNMSFLPGRKLLP